jgi:hypothetical protein
MFTHMEMLRELKMEQTGASLASMVLGNAKETLLKLVLLNYLTIILKVFHLLFALRAILMIGPDQEKTVHLNLISIGRKLILVPQEFKEINGKFKWLLPLKNLNPLTLMFHGLLSMEFIQQVMNLRFLPTWLNLYAQSIKAPKKLMPANDLTIQLLSFYLLLH